MGDGRVARKGRVKIGETDGNGSNQMKQMVEHWGSLRTRIRLFWPDRV